MAQNQEQEETHFSGKEICMKGDTYIYNGNLYLTGNIDKGSFNATSGAWTQEKILNDYLVIKGVKVIIA